MLMKGVRLSIQRMTFCCFKQCLKLRPKALENLHNKYNIAMCPHIRNRTGFSKHMYVKSASGGPG